MKACITTTVDEEYYGYVPMFKHCVKLAYPGVDCIVFARGDYPKPSEVVELRDGCQPGAYVTASLRFILGEDQLARYDHVLITDVDIMIQRESPSFVQQHLNHMKMEGLKSYSNCDHGDHMPGVHFIDQSWWDATRKARMKYLDVLKEEAVPLDYDEWMLKRIVLESNLTVGKTPIMWAIHGLHVGKFRGRGVNEVRFRPNEFEFLDGMMNDEHFMLRVATACDVSPLVRDTWARLLAVYQKRKG